MRGAIIYGSRDIRFEERPDPTIVEPTDAIVRTVAACVCGSDLWRYRGIQEVTTPTPIGHEYVGIVEAVGGEVTSVRPGPVRRRWLPHQRQHLPGLPGRHALELPERHRLRRLSGRADPGARTPTAPSWPRQSDRTTRWCRASWPCPT